MNTPIRVYNIHHIQCAYKCLDTIVHEVVCIYTYSVKQEYNTLPGYISRYPMCQRAQY